MQRRAFTLIELLIVVAIIAILAAIAVPNFLEAQTRAKVSRVKADFRAMKTAITSYQVDYNTYPCDARFNTPPTNPPNYKGSYNYLTRPVPYITSIPFDPFGEVIYNGGRWPAGYWLLSGRDGVNIAGWGNSEASSYGAWPIDIWYICSAGPDKDLILDYSNSPQLGTLGQLKLRSFPVGQGWGYDGWTQDALPKSASEYVITDTYKNDIPNVIYDSTNGTISFGDIASSGGVIGNTETLRRFRSYTE